MTFSCVTFTDHLMVIDLFWWFLIYRNSFWSISFTSSCPTPKGNFLYAPLANFFFSNPTPRKIKSWLLDFSSLRSPILPKEFISKCLLLHPPPSSRKIGFWKKYVSQCPPLLQCFCSLFKPSPPPPKDWLLDSFSLLKITPFSTKISLFFLNAPLLSRRMSPPC